MIKAVLFDYGGVVKIGHPLSMDIMEICNISKEELKKVEDKRAQLVIQAETGVISDEQFWEEFSKIISKPLPDSPKNCEKLAKKIYRETFVFVPEVIGLVKKLKTQGIRTAVLSNIYKFEAEVIREKYGYKEFDPVILSYEVGMRKPEINIYLLAIEKLKVKPEECIFIDDKEKNLLPAEELGMKTVLARSPEQIVKDVLFIVN